MPLLAFELEVVTARHRLLREGQRHVVAAKGQRRAAMELAAELIKHDDFCEPALKSLAPCPCFAARNLRKCFA